MLRLGAFFRLWAMLLVAYALARLGVDYLLRQSFDMRPVSALEYIVVSFGQAVVYRLVAPQKPTAPPAG
jgi:hypothetical protein